MSFAFPIVQPVSNHSKRIFSEWLKQPHPLWDQSVKTIEIVVIPKERICFWGVLAEKVAAAAS